MNKQVRPRSAVMVAAALSLCANAWAFNSGSTGADGALAPTVNTVIQLPPSGVLNYTSINIPPGVTVSFQKNATNTPVYLLSSGDVYIGGAIDVSAGNAANTGEAGGGALGDDGLPGPGGPGGYDGGRGGFPSANGDGAIRHGGPGLGPGGGQPGIVYWNPNAGTWGGYVGGNAGFNQAGPGSGGWWLHAGGGAAYGSDSLQPLIGGSGGGGGLGGLNFTGGGGGGGGGAILIAASGTVTVGGGVYSWGGWGGWSAGQNAGGAGGGGAGGAIRIVATTITGGGQLMTGGGCSPSNQNCESVASDGRVHLEAETLTFTGATRPGYSVAAPTPAFLAAVPSIRITSVGDANVPTAPTGNADVTLPATTTGPVAVSFATTNVPVGNVVQLTVTPAYGDIITVQSPALTGTTASASASVNVTLPQGPSTLLASVSYTITVAQGEALSRFANNERVEKVELLARMGGGAATVNLITVSGKRFEAPASVLQGIALS